MIVFESTLSHKTATKRKSKSGSILSMYHYTSKVFDLSTKVWSDGPEFKCLSNSTKAQIQNANIKAYEASKNK